MSGELLKELEEDIHQEEWWTFWKTYGPLIAGLVVLTLLATGGYLWWRSKRQTAFEEESTRYEAALSSLETKGPNAQAQEILEDLSLKASPGYATLAQLQLFRLNAIRAETDTAARAEAEKKGKTLVQRAQKNRDVGLQGVMVLNLAALSLNTHQPLADDLQQCLSQYDVPQNPWKGLTLEIQGLQKLSGSRKEEAQKIYTHLLTITEIGQGVQMRAGMEMIGAALPFPERTS